MKRLMICILLLGLGLMLAACGETEEPQPAIAAITHDEHEETEEHTPTEDEQPYEHNEIEDAEEIESQDNLGFALLYRGTLIEMDQGMDYLLAELGEPLGVFEAPSCAFDGIDRIFGFPGIQIHTYPDGELDRVHTISFLDDSLSTVNGIFLGSSWDDVVAAYGSGYVQDITMFTYTIGRTTLSFFVEGDMVTGIIYGLIMD